MSRSPAERPIGLNELPRYSPWPARLLGAEPCERREKTRPEVLREFESEKWGELARRVAGAGRRVSHAEVEAWDADGAAIEVASRGDELMLLPIAEIRRRHVDLVAETLRPYWPAPALVELGTGFGSVLVPLAAREPFRQSRVLGADLTSSGKAVLEHVAETEGVNVEAGLCDLTADPVVTMPVPEGAVIFTSFAAMYMPRLAKTLIGALSRLRPKAVVHFEPVFEHYAVDTLLGLLRQRYLVANDYNTDLATVLHREAAAGTIRILDEQRTVFGQNALLPASILAWTPA